MSAKRSWSAVLVAMSLATTACSFEHTSELLTPTMPSVDSHGTVTPAPGAGLMGLWASAAPLGDPETWVCGSFQWNITEQTPTSLSGSFSGLCGGIVLIQGNGSGQLNGETVTLTVSGQASVSGVLTTCPFSITANGFLEGEDAIHVNYSGSTCLGPVNGSEVLRRPSLAVPTPPAPTPQTPNTPPSTPSGNPYHAEDGPHTADRAYKILEATADEFPHLAGAQPTGDQAVAAAHELLLRYIWHLQQAGFSAGRQRNPSGAISGDKLTIWLENQWKAYDIFFDVGAANRPAEIIFWEVFPADHVPDGGIPD